MDRSNETSADSENPSSSTAPSLAGCVFLIIGGTGQSGICAVRRLLSIAAEDTVVRVMSRSADPVVLRKLFDADVEVVKGDVADASRVQEAMVDVTHVLYLVGPKPSPSYAWNGRTVEAAYVTGLEHVLAAGRAGPSSLRQVLLLSAENCDRPWFPMSMMANTIAGMSQLMHLRQERLLREEARRREDFSYVVVRPPILGPGDSALRRCHCARSSRLTARQAQRRGRSRARPSWN